MFDLKINDVSKSVQSFSLAINDNINANSTASFQIITDDEIAVGQQVEIYDGTEIIFGGTIDNWNLNYIRGGNDYSNRRKYDIFCVDYNQVLDRRIVAASYTNKTLGYIIDDIVTNFLDGELITISGISDTNVIIEAVIFNYISIFEAFEYLALIIGGDLNFNINYDKELSFFKRSTNTDEAINDLNCLNMSLSETRAEYRNSQFIRAGDSTTEIQVDELASPKPDGESKTFTFRFPLATKPVIKLNGSTISPTNIGINGLDKNKSWYWQKNSRVISQDTSDTPLSSTDSLTASYQGLKPILVKVDNTVGQSERALLEGGTGIYERLTMQTDIEEADEAKKYASGLLSKFGEMSRKINISSDSTREAGTLVQVKSGLLGINEEYLITNVSIRDNDGLGTLRYTIDGASGKDIGGWVEFFRSLKKGQTPVVKENEVLILSQSTTETEKYKGETTIEMFKPITCGEDVFVSETLIVGGPLLEEVIIND